MFRLVIQGHLGSRRPSVRKGYRMFPSHYYQKAKGVLVLYSITDRDSFSQVEEWVAELKRENSEAAVVLVGSKVDLWEERKVSYWEGAGLAERLGVPFLETSAWTPANVNQAFYLLTTLICAKTGISAGLGFKRI